MKPRIGVVQFTAVCAEGHEHALACGVTFEVARRLTSIGGMEANAILLGRSERAGSTLGESVGDLPAFGENAAGFSVPRFGAQFESDYIVLGRLQVSDGLLFFYRVYEVESGRLMRSGCVNGLRTAVFRLLDELTQHVRESIDHFPEEPELSDYDPVFDDVDFSAFVEYCLARSAERPATTMKHLARALEVEPRFRMALVEYLAGCYEVDDTQGALRLVDNYLTEEPDDDEIRIAAANLCLAFNHIDEGIDYASRCLESRLGEAEPHVLMARFLFAREMVGEAGVHLEAALNAHDESPEAKYALGRYFLDLGDYYRARDYFEACLESDPGYIVALRDVQCCYYELGDFGKAIRACESLLESDPTDAGSYYNLGLVYQRLGREHLAVKYFEESVRRDPDFFKAIYMMGEYKLAHGRPREALTHYEEAHRVAPSSAEALGRIGDCHVELGAEAEGYRHYVWARREDPSFENARFHLIEGVTLGTDGDLEGACHRLEKAIEMDGGLVEGWNELAWVLLQLGQPEAALDRIRRALDLRPDHASLLANLLTVASRLPLGLRLTGAVRRLVRDARARARSLRSAGKVPPDSGKRRVRRFPGFLTWYALKG